MIAAIAAAFLAGGIALFREWRLERRRLVVAARITSETLNLAHTAATVTAERRGWTVWDRVPGLDEFQAIWEGHRNVLAGHLTRSEWGTVAGATTRYILRFAAERSDPPDDLDVKILREIAADLRAAEETLDRYCYEGPHVTDRVREAFRRLRGVRRASRDGSS